MRTEKNCWIFQVEKEGALRRMRVFFDAATGKGITYPFCVIPDDLFELKVVDHLDDLFSTHGPPNAIINRGNFNSKILEKTLYNKGIKYDRQNP